MIDLKFPIDSIFCNLVSGQDHFSSEIIDQLQLSCFQAQPSLQLAIQQFRIAVDSLASKSSEIEDIDSDEDEITPQVSPITSTAEPFVSPFTNSPLFGSDDLISAGVGQGSMLKMLKSTGTINATTTTSNIATPASTAATNTSTATPVVNVSNIRKSDPVMTTPMEADAMSLASAGPLSPTLSVASEKAHSQSKSILGLLKGIMVPTPTPAASTASEKILPVTAISAPPTIPVTTTSVLAAASVVSTSVVEEEEEEEEVSSTMAPSTTTVPRVPSYSSASPDIALDTGSANSSISRALSEVKYQIVELRKEQATKTAESHIHIKDTVIEKIQKAVHESTHSSNKKLAITIKELLKGAVEEQQSQLSAVTTAAVRSSIDSEVKKSLDSTLKNKAFTDEITKAVADAVKTEIIASINLSLPQIISSTVKEAVTQSLSSTFRLAFENTLLPSFEAGTTRMFAQVEESFDSGLDRLEKQAQYTTESTRQTVDELQGEVASLKSIIGSLENKMSLLINAIESGALTSGGNALSIGTTSNNTDKAQKKLQDPILLLKQGKIPESLECALEYKSIEKLVELLAAMTGPSQLAENCDYLLQLCAIQQLAADFAKTYPIEVCIFIYVCMSYKVLL